MERMFILIAVLVVAYLVARDAVDLFSSRERGLESEDDIEPQFRYFQPDEASPAMDYLKLGVAYAIDLLPFALLLTVVHLTIMPLDRIVGAEISASPDSIDLLMDAMLALIAILMSFTVAKVMHVLVVGRTGRSLGWFLTGFRVTDEDGSQPKMWDYVKRSLDHTPMVLSDHANRRRTSSSRIRYIARDCRLVRA